ncbi:MAG: glycosyltransferase family 4 protein [Conexivisphaerales archaeon]
MNHAMIDIARTHQVIVLDRNHEGYPSSELVKGVRVYRLNSYADSLLSRGVLRAPGVGVMAVLIERLIYSFKVLVEAIRLRPSVILCNSVTVSLFLVLARPRRYKMVYQSMSAHRGKGYNFINSWRVAFLKVAEDFVFRHTDRIMVDYIDSQDDLLMKMVKLPRRVWEIPVTVDDRFWSQVDDKRYIEDFRRTLGLAPNQVMVLYHGRILPHKGLHYLLDAFQLVLQKNDHVMLFIVGPTVEGISPSRRDLDYLDLLRNKIERARMDGRVKIVAGWQPSEIVRTFYEACDIFIHPSQMDVIPHTVRQAMSMGKPVVSTDVGGVGKLIRNEWNGYLVKPTDISAMASAILALVERPETRVAFGQISRNYVSVNCSIQRASMVIQKALTTWP